MSHTLQPAQHYSVGISYGPAWGVTSLGRVLLTLNPGQRSRDVVVLQPRKRVWVVTRIRTGTDVGMETNGPQRYGGL